MAWLPWFRARNVQVAGGMEVGVEEQGYTGKRQVQKAGRNTAPFAPADDDPGDEASGQFQWIEGRRHMSNVPYILPKDVQEVNRLDFQHYMMRYAMQRNYVAPIENPRGILDVGCGTGRWAQEMAVAFPRAKVFGMDMVAEEAKSATKPINYRFVQGNILEELPFPDATFEFVHQRFMHMAIPMNNWGSVAKELVRVTRPNGWVEMVESDLVMRNIGPATRQLTVWGFELSRQRNIDPRVCTQTPYFLHQAGLINIQKYRIDLPIGSWGGRLGIMAVTDLYAFNRALRPLVIARFNVPPERFDELTSLMRQEWETHHTFFSVYLACGQRPAY
jgi:ubiquinone/menaquinone biosynthesis C-methylase UbiE